MSAVVKDRGRRRRARGKRQPTRQRKEARAVVALVKADLRRFVGEYLKAQGGENSGFTFGDAEARLVDRVARYFVRGK